MTVHNKTTKKKPNCRLLRFNGISILFLYFIFWFRCFPQNTVYATNGFASQIMFVAHSIFWTWNNDNLLLLLCCLVLLYLFCGHTQQTILDKKLLLLLGGRRWLRRLCVIYQNYFKCECVKDTALDKSKVIHKFECHKHRAFFNQKGYNANRKKKKLLLMRL